MKMRERQHERGFTMVELISSIGASAVVMMAVMSLMGMTQREWTRGKDSAYLMSETAVTFTKVARELRTAKLDSVTVSAARDTLKIGSGKRFYKNSQDLVFQGPGGTMTFLKGMATQFTVMKPVVRAPGDTLKSAVKVTLAMQKNDVQDTTSVTIAPRAN